MHRIVQRSIGLLAALLVFVSGPYLHAQTPIVEEPNYTPTLTFDVATIRLNRDRVERPLSAPLHR